VASISPKPWVDFAYECLFALGAMAVGAVFGRSAERAAVERARLRKAEADRDEATRHAAAAERARILMELHDVIGHSLSVMMLQAGGARLRLEHDDRTAAREALSAVEDLGHRALSDMRRMLGLLRRDTPPGPVSPHAGLARLSDLVHRMERSGLAVELTDRELTESLPFAIDVAAYHLIESALAVAISIQARTAKVAIRRRRAAVEIELRSGGEERLLTGDAVQAAEAALRQRVEIYKGSLTIEGRDGPGRIVRVLLPLAEQRA
jgi:signal transduction histidine kinase